MDYGGNSVVVIDTDAGKVVRRLFTGSKPYGVAVGAEGRFLYVANSGGSEISVIDLDALTPLGCIPLSFRPFDLLLGLIAKHKLDVTEVALSQVTDEFIAYIRSTGGDWDLGQASEFLVVAATLLDLKAARLLPAADVEDEDDLES